MSRRQLLLLAAALSACADPETPGPTAPLTPADLTPHTAIVDARSGGNAHFFWLPPIAPATTYPGTFDATASPELRICPFANNACAVAPAVYTRSSSPAITVSTSAQSFSLDWSTKPASIGSGDYRAEVRLSNRLLGFADVRVVANQKDLKSVPAGFVGVQDGKSLIFAFRIESGIVGSVSIAPRNDSVIVGNTLQYTATVRDLNGAVIQGAPVTWTSSIPSRATIGATGLATGVSTGFTTIVATSGGVLDSTFLRVVPVPPAPVARVVVSPSGTIPLTVGQHQAFSAATYDAANNVLTGRSITWTTNDASVVTIGPDGLATAIGAGISFIVATSEGKRDSAFVDVTGPTVTCLRPWALPYEWFAPNVYGTVVTGHLGVNFQVVPPGTTPGNYYPPQLTVGGGAGDYTAGIVTCSSAQITLGTQVNLALGNLFGPTVAALDTLFSRDPGAAWDPSANGGQGGIVGSSAPAGTESARVVQVGLYAQSENQSSGVSSIRLRRTAFVFLESYVRVNGVPPGGTRGDITFRFLRFGQ
jgi:uncharacterized protein YjdB